MHSNEAYHFKSPGQSNTNNALERLRQARHQRQEFLRHCSVQFHAGILSMREQGKEINNLFSQVLGFLGNTQAYIRSFNQSNTTSDPTNLSGHLVEP